MPVIEGRPGVFVNPSELPWVARSEPPEKTQSKSLSDPERTNYYVIPSACAMKKECPRCHQGMLLAATIKVSNERVIVCDECEAIWTDPGQVLPENFQDMVTFLKRRGIEGAWNALTIREGGNTA